MANLTADKDLQPTGGNQSSRWPLVASEITFVGSLLSMRTTGFAARLTAGEPFCGVAVKRVEAKDWPVSGAANGDRFIDCITGRFSLLVALTVTATDPIKRRKVYASDDQTFTFTAAGNTYIGEVVAVIGTTFAVVECTTSENRDSAPGIQGVISIADANTTLDMTHVGKVVMQPVSAARQVTLPPAADWIGKTITVCNSGGAFAITIAGNAAEIIGSANTLVQAATKGRSTVLYSTGIASNEIAILANQ